jgi:hypothetical protein
VKKLILSSCLGLIAAAAAPAAIINFDLTGVAGNGLLPGNEPGSITGGTGGEIGQGITFDTATSNLVVRVGWGSANGFVDLSSAANNSHIHGPTATNYGNGFTQTAGVVFNLTRSSNLATGGTISNTFALTASQVSNLFNGKYYINIHTVTNVGGEMRGFLVPVPVLDLAVTPREPVNFDLTGVAGTGLLPGNEPGSITGGTGGEIGPGITFDPATSNLNIQVGWGSANGFVDLTSAANNSHLHGPTATNNGNGFTQTAGVAFNLTRSSDLPTGGTISQTLNLNGTQVANLFDGKFYINIHTVTNGGGEMRGFLVPVPQKAILTVSGVPGQKQIIQASGNLLTWTPVATNTAGVTPFAFVETNPALNSQRYYRAVVLP